MAEINERANEYISKIEGMRCEELDGFISHVFHTMPTKEQLEARKNWGIHDAWKAFVDGVTEQKSIDIDKAWQWMVDWVFENAPHEVFDELMSSREEYIKAMEG